MINLEKAKKVLSSLEKRGLTLGSVESLTAGLFASTICSVPGASKVFKGSFVTYATSMKTDFLNINKAFINKYGVVSKEVAREMAIIGRHGLEVDVCVSFTGNAGPSAMEGKPVGDIHIGIASQAIAEVYSLNIEGTRREIQEKAVEFAINKLLEKI